MLFLIKDTNCEMSLALRKSFQCQECGKGLGKFLTNSGVGKMYGELKMLATASWEMSTFRRQLQTNAQERIRLETIQM